MNDPRPPVGFPESEREAIAFHSRVALDAEQVLLEGFDLLLGSLDPLQGHTFGEQAEQRVMMAFFVQTLNSLRCAFQLATQGYYLQALNLTRPVVEEWMAYWYLRNFPERHGQFTATDKEPPPFNDMLQAIEARQSRKRKSGGDPPSQPERWARSWMKEQHQFSHVILSRTMGTASRKCCP